MNNTARILFRVIRSLVCGEGGLPPVSEIEDTRALYELSHKMDMAHLVGFWLQENPLGESEQQAQAAFGKQYMMAIYRYQHLTYELKRIGALFERGKIKYMPLKGSVIRSLYPKAWMRTSCDIDILVEECELERAAELLIQELKYKAEGERHYHDMSLFSPSGVHLELHFNIKENTPGMDAVLERVWDYSSPSEGEYRYVQSDEYLLFHQIAHAAYHFSRGGCGIRPVLDIWLLARRGYDADALDGLLSEANLRAFAEGIFALGEVWFGVGEHTSLTLSMEDFILGAGAYGSAENQVAVSRAESKGKFRYILSRIFMPYSSMQHRFPVLQKHPWLLPFCHVARWLGLLLPSRRRNVRRELRNNAAIDDGRARAVREMLGELDLIERDGEKK